MIDLPGYGVKHQGWKSVGTFWTKDGIVGTKLTSRDSVISISAGCIFCGYPLFHRIGGFIVDGSLPGLQVSEFVVKNGGILINIY